MSDVVTGEAVALDLRLARLPSRALAVLLDAALQIAVLAGLLFLAGRLLSGGEPALVAAIRLVLTVAALVGYPVLAETMTRGRTVGKAVFGLRVVRDDGGPIRFRQALVRGLLGFFVDLWTTIGIGAIAATTMSERGKRLGDVLAGTVVIRERAPAALVAAPGMPPELGAWALTADLSRVNDDLALAARQVLGRRAQLAEDAYLSVTGRLADAVAAVVSPPPPVRTGADRYLAAVLAERRRRADERLRRYGGREPLDATTERAGALASAGTAGTAASAGWPPPVAPASPAPPASASASAAPPAPASANGTPPAAPEPPDPPPPAQTAAQTERTGGGFALPG